MNRLHYAGHSVVTGSAIARALLAYAQAIAQNGSTAVVAVPTVNSDGSLGCSDLLIGPASQLMSADETSAFPELIDKGVVTWLHLAAERLRGSDTTVIIMDAMAEDALEGWSDYDL